MQETAQEVRRVLTSSGTEGADELHVDVQGTTIRLLGRLQYWDDVVRVGHAVATGLRTNHLICEVEAEDQHPDTAPKQPQHPVGALPASADVVIVGGGIIGMAIARELIKHQCRVLVLDSGDSIGGATTSWNNGMIHSGHDPAPGTLKAMLNVRGNHLWRAWAAELGVRLSTTGSVRVAFDEADTEDLKLALGRAKQNGVPGAELLDRNKAFEVEPNLRSEIVAALWTPSASYIDPVGAARAMAEDVFEYEGDVVLRAPVTEISTEGKKVVGVGTPTSQIEAAAVVNAAGIHADTVAKMAGCQRYSIHPRRGTLLKFGAEQCQDFHRSVGLPSHSYTKGGGVGPAVAGPTAVEQADRYTATPSTQEIEAILDKIGTVMPTFPINAVTEVGAGLRAATYSEDFIIEPDADLDGFFHVAGIQSPGVASAPAIAELVAAQLRDRGFIRASQSGFVPRAERLRDHAAS